MMKHAMLVSHSGKKVVIPLRSLHVLSKLKMCEVHSHHLDKEQTKNVVGDSNNKKTNQHDNQAENIWYGLARRGGSVLRKRNSYDC